MPMTRRRLMLAAALLPVLTVGTTGVLAIASGEQTSAEASQDKHLAAPVIPASTTAGSVVQVVAHPDDDLFFMNPDLSRSLTAGIPVTTVYLTSGEADGRNEAAGGAAKDPEQPADRAHYAEARQNGIRCAYAQMATGTARARGSARSYPPSAAARPKSTSSSPTPRSTWSGSSCARPAAPPPRPPRACAACGTARYPPWRRSSPRAPPSSSRTRTPRTRWSRS